jgi:flavin-dependent dehydrogenase
MKMKAQYDALIIGAGLSGLHCARRLAEGGASVLLADRKEDLGKGVHTTGIFVRKTFEDFSFPAGSLGRAVAKVRLYSPGLRAIELESDLPEYRIGDMALIYRSLLAECRDLGVEFIGGARYSASIADRSRRGGSIVRLKKDGENIDIRTKVLIGADGTGSIVAKDLELDRNTEWIVGCEQVVEGVPGRREPALHCFLDAELAPGYIAWIADDGEECHIGVGGYPERFDPKPSLAEFSRRVVPRILDTRGGRVTERRGGKIPVGGVLKNISNERGLLIGDAAGAVSPLTAGGLDPCLRLSEYAAETVLARLTSGRPDLLKAYSGKMFRRKFIPRLLLRTILRTVKYQVQFELLFRAITTRPGRFFAEKIFYRRASFPDISATHPARRAIAEAVEAGRGRPV